MRVGHEPTSTTNMVLFGGLPIKGIVHRRLSKGSRWVVGLAVEGNWAWGEGVDECPDGLKIAGWVL